MLVASNLACNADSDCTWVGPLHLCPGAVACAANPANLVAAARYHDATKGVPLTEVPCVRPPPVECINHVCAKVPPGRDAGEAGTDDAGGPG